MGGKTSLYYLLLCVIFLAACSSGGSSGPDLRAPIHVSPVNGLRIGKSNIKVHYRDLNPNDAVYARLIIATDPALQNIIHQQRDITVSSGSRDIIAYAPEGLAKGVTYYYGMDVYPPGNTTFENSELYVKAFVLEQTGSNIGSTYVAMGDSITAGDQGGDRPDTTPYTTYLQDMLTTYIGPVTVANEGIPGARAQDLLLYVDTFLSFHSPGYAIILIGANDIILDHGDPELIDNVIANIETIVYTCMANQTIPLLSTLTPAIGDRAFLEPEVLSINGRIQAFCQAGGVDCLDIHSRILDYADDISYLYTDGIHFNTQGYEVVAECYYDLLRSRTGNVNTSGSRIRLKKGPAKQSGKQSGKSGRRPVFTPKKRAR